MKEVYETPEIELVTFEAEDVITTSNVGGASGNDLPPMPISLSVR